MPFAEFVGESGRVYAFEPQNTLYNILCGNLALNNLQNVDVAMKALGASSGHLQGTVPSLNEQCNLGEFQLHSTETQDPTISWLPASESSNTSKVVRASKTIEVSTLDDELAGIDHDQVLSFIKIDVEGMELDVLQGAVDTIQKSQPVMYLENDRPENHEKLVSFLINELDYALFWSINNLFNSENYRGKAQNIFRANLHSYNVLALPRKSVDSKWALLKAFGLEMIHLNDSHPLARQNIGIYSWLEDLSRFEARKYSQNGEDGVLFELFNRFGVTNKCYVEIGASDGVECNSRFFRELYGWTGVMIDSNNEDHSIHLYKAYVTSENVVAVLNNLGVPNTFDLLSLDIDMNDYWVLKSILESKNFFPRLVVVEVNAALGPNISKAVSYGPDNTWQGDTYHGASVLAFAKLMSNNYTLVYCEANGVNCFFVANSVLEKFGLTSLSGIDNTHLIYRKPRYFGYTGYAHPEHPPSLNKLWVTV